MSKTRIVIAIITLLMTLGLCGLGIAALISLKIGLALVCFMIGGVAGYFNYNDVKYFMSKKSG